MTSRRDALRAMSAFASLPWLEHLDLEQIADLGRHAHDVAEERRRAAEHAYAKPRALTAAEYAMVVAAAERIIPRTSTPGATDARVADFIDVMLADWHDAAERARFKSGLKELDVRARAVASATFVRLTPVQQTSVLEALDGELQEQRRARRPGVNDHWFAMLKHLTAWGYYTSRVGIVQELRVDVFPGIYDGNAAY